jgi:ATP-dependent Clp protease ATP-binding subunit ClpC
MVAAAIIDPGMFERYTEPARKTIFFARYEAAQFGNTEIQPEHILLGILRADARLAIRLLGSAERGDSMRRRIEEAIPRGSEKLPVSVDLPLSAPGKRVLDSAAEESERLNHAHIGTEHLLVGLMREETSLAFQIMTEQGLTLAKLVEQAAKSVPLPAESPPGLQGYVRAESSERPREQPFRDLTALASEGLLGPLIGREHELERIIRILSRRTRKNPVLIGEPGVGKTAIVEGLALHMAKGIMPAALAGRTMLATDAAALTAPKSAGNLAAHSVSILFVDGLFDLASSRYNWGVLEATRILEPLLARSGLQCIATGTPAGYRETCAKAPLLAVHFEPVPVLPPNETEALEILRGVKDQYEKHHDVIIVDETIEAAVVASGRFLRHRFLPDRALDLLDEAAALVSLRIEQHKMENAIGMGGSPKAREHATENAPSNIVTSRDIAEVAAGLVGAPVAVVENVMQQPDSSRVERIARELVSLMPQGREWLDGLATYLAGCTEEEAARLADQIDPRRQDAAQP